MAGTVWAMEHATPPAPIDGVFTRLLIVRDLASGEQLLTGPTMGEGADEVVQTLSGLFELHGPPLVIKRDNGSGLSADPVDLLLAFSPATSPAHRSRRGDLCCVTMERWSGTCANPGGTEL